MLFLIKPYFGRRRRQGLKYVCTMLLAHGFYGYPVVQVQNVVSFASMAIRVVRLCSSCAYLDCESVTTAPCNRLAKVLRLAASWLFKG
ncbi:hypothetical protein OUZ56_017283 [Daphnia magna]|uniref:Secreted protein n=1 Tax=Daphnia magna TaxID=35525 RepID=A0ABR0ASS5_9CRUS|nr:hypothetical protein OUZ56_017283 [Daphnia magna]